MDSDNFEHFEEQFDPETREPWQPVGEISQCIADTWTHLAEHLAELSHENKSLHGVIQWSSGVSMEFQFTDTQLAVLVQYPPDFLSAQMRKAHNEDDAL